MTNSLNQIQNLPKFSAISPEHVASEITQHIAACKQVIEDVLSHNQYSWQNLVAPLDDVNDILDRNWSPVSHMNSVVSNDALREAHDECLPMLSQYATFVGQHDELFAAYQTLKLSDEFSALSKSQQRVIDNSLRDFRLSGIALSAEKKQRFAAIKQSLSELSSTFGNNVMDATLGWTKHITDPQQLSGLPESATLAAKQAAEEKSLSGWLFTLDIPSYLPVMTYADCQQLRQEMYIAYTSRASDQGPNAGQWDNSEVIEQTLALRFELAQLLGYQNYSEYSLATKMADSSEQVIDFLNQLVEPSRKQALNELAELTTYAQQQHQVDQLNAWDIGYYSEKLKQATYNISDEELRPYFPEPVVVKGLFAVVNRLFGLRIEQQQDIDTWHSDVNFYHIYDNDNTLRGAFYLDLYARAKKRGGAWMDECQVKMQKQDGELQLPVAYLTCNFNGPIGEQPALFTHDEVVTLFHEFGHGIHHMLTQITTAGVSGINGVAWDAVELPSQFLENWCWQAEGLALISGHYQTGETLPPEMLEKLLAARNFQSAMQMVRQLEFSLFDFQLHQSFGQPDYPGLQGLLDQIRARVSVITPPKSNRFQHSFGHIFAGGYAAGYYSYKWAEVLSSDAFAKFEEDGIFNPDTGQSFLQHILEKGGSEEPMVLFKNFRGREPSVEPLLRHSGIITK